MNKPILNLYNAYKKKYAKDVIIENLTYKAIVKDSIEDNFVKIIQTDNSVMRFGDYVDYYDESADRIDTYIIREKVLTKLYYDETKMRQCNAFLKYKGIIDGVEGIVTIPTTIFNSTLNIKFWECFKFSDNISGATYSVLKIDSSHALLSYAGDNSFLNCQLMLVMGDKLFLLEHDVFNAVTSNNITSALLDSTHAIVNYTSGNGTLWSVVVTIGDFSLTKGVITQTCECRCYYCHTTPIDSTHVQVISAIYSSFNMYSIILTIKGNIISPNEMVKANDVKVGGLCAISLDNNRVLVCYENTGVSAPTPLYSTILGVNGGTGTSLTNIIAHAPNPQLVAMESIVSGSKGKFMHKGICDKFTGLIPSTDYYVNNDLKLTTELTNYPVGVALSDTELLIKDAFWEKV